MCIRDSLLGGLDGQVHQLVGAAGPGHGNGPVSYTHLIVYEPWHYRYVGKEYAQDIHEKGLCLEKYLEQWGK